jgi:O-antigen/teichoic acid export membrane protein
MKWVRNGIWAILDQGLFALSNFLINLFLARWLTPSEYGSFSIVFIVFLMFGTFHSALVTEPMVVFASNAYKTRLPAYMSMVFYSHWGLTLLFSSLCLLLAAIAWFQHYHMLAFSIVGLAVASPLILYQWLARRVCYVSLKPHLAGYAGVLYATLMSLGGLLLYHYQWINGASILLLMGTASFCSGLYSMTRLKIWNPRIPTDLPAIEYLNNHWGHGKWMVGTSLMSWAFSNVFLLLLPIASGLESTGAARALLVTLMPMFLVITAVNHLLLPLLVRIRTESSFNRVVCSTAACLILASMCYGSVIGLFNETIINYFFNGHYVEYANLLWVLVILLPLMALVMIIGVAIRAFERPERQFADFLRSSYISLPVGFALTGVWGIWGAAIAMVLSQTILAMYLLSSYYRFVYCKISGREKLSFPSVKMSEVHTG